MRRSSSLLRVVVLVSVLMIAAALTPTAAAPAAAAVPAEQHGQPRSGYICAWPAIGGAQFMNAFLPETNATYWMFDYVMAPGQKLVIHGVYPFARFFEFTTYDNGTPIDPGGNLVDAEIQPQAGSKNPFQTAKASDDPSKRHYRVVVEANAGPSSTNVLSAGVSGGNGTLIYRVYVPDNPDHLKADVHLPRITDVDPSGAKTRLPLCKGTQTSAAPAGNSVAAPVSPRTAQCLTPMQFCLPDTAGGLYPNPANKYLHTDPPFVSGQVVVVTGKAPTFPDTVAGQSPTAASDMRYWSICQNLGAPIYPVIACKADYQIPLTGDRSYTIVISAEEDRPSNADKAHGVAWMPWGDTSQGGVILVRNMLPADAFCCSIQNVDPLDTPPYTVMGPYYPLAKYCTKAGFESAASACIAQPPPP